MRIVCKYGYVDKQITIREQLREAGFRVTPARLALLELLARGAKPLSVPSILEKISSQADQATVYRSLRSLVKAGLVKRIRIQPDISHYEYAELAHHHHIICERCGLVEDVTVCCEDPRPAVSSFSHITHHSLEFSGICLACAD